MKTALPSGATLEAPVAETHHVRRPFMVSIAHMLLPFGANSVPSSIVPMFSKLRSSVVSVTVHRGRAWITEIAAPSERRAGRELQATATVQLINTAAYM
jgi:hypothetical protein